MPPGESRPSLPNLNGRFYSRQSPKSPQYTPRFAQKSLYPLD